VPVLALPPVLFLVLLYALPVATLVAEVVSASTVEAALERPGLARVVRFTLWQALLSTSLTLVVGLPVAWLLARWSFPGRRALHALVTVPFLLPTVVVGAAFLALLPDRVDGGLPAIVLAHAFVNVAVVVRVVGALWEQVPPDLGAAARTLGAPPWRVAWSVTLPLLRPAVAAAASVVFLFTATSFGIVRILGGPRHPTLEVEVVRRATQLGDVGGAAVLALGQLVVLAALVAWAARVQASATRGVPLVPPRRPRPRTRRERAVVTAAASATAAAVAAPLLVLAAASLRPGGRWSTRAWRDLGDGTTGPGLSLGVDPAAAVVASLRTAVVATVVGVALGGLAALALAAARRRRAAAVADAAFALPLATSAVTIGLGMLITFDGPPFDWRGGPWLVPLGHALIAVPFVVRAALPALRARPSSWADAAASLGASPLRAWWELDVRLVRRPLVVGAAFAAAISLGEFGATTFLSRTGDETVPIAVDRLLARAGDLPRAQGFALATILAALVLAVVLGVEGLQRERRRG